MPLPSQSGRSAGRSRASTRRRRRRSRRPLALLVLVVAAVGVAGWYFWGGDADQPSEQPGETKLAANNGTPESAEQPRNQIHGTKTPESTPPTSDVPKADTVRRPEPVGSNSQNPTPSAPTPSGVVPADVSATLRDAEDALSRGELVDARSLLNQVLLDPRTPRSERTIIREQMGAINEELIFGPRILPNDPLVDTYRVQGGDSLDRIARNEGLAVDWRFLQRINGLANPNMIRRDQTLKIVRGPFHAVVYKDQYRMDVFAGPPDDPSNWMFIRSFNVGLGSDDSTPVGEFVVRSDSKLVNPTWTNPRTGEVYAADNPENPIGERWLGLQGVGQYAALAGYGIHGTIEPDSIGTQASMGCVRLKPVDIEIVYEMLAEAVSVVVIEE